MATVLKKAEVSEDLGITPENFTKKSPLHFRMFPNPETKYELKVFRIKISQPKKVIFVWMDLFMLVCDFPWGATSQVVKCNRRKMPKMEQFLTAEEVAEALKLRPYTVRRLCREGKIPCFKFGGQWGFKKAEIDGFNKREKQTKVFVNISLG